MNDRKLNLLTTSATQRWPDSAITIGRAAQHVRDGKVQRIDPETDSWVVSGIQCSFAANACACRDHTIDPVGGKMRICEHLLAVMLAKRLGDSQDDGERVPAHMAGVVKFLGECRGDERTRLLISIEYDQRTRGTKGDRYTLAGFHRMGQPANNLRYEERADFTQADLVSALMAAGWRIHQKTQGMYMTWKLILVPMTERDRRLDPDLATAIGVLDVVSAHVIERNEQRAEMKRLFALDTGEQFARGLVGVGGAA